MFSEETQQNEFLSLDGGELDLRWSHSEVFTSLKRNTTYSSDRSSHLTLLREYTTYWASQQIVTTVF